MSLEGKRACVVGAGFGGLALAIRLQAAGIATTLIEARDRPGGSAWSWQEDGFTFDGGPAAISCPSSLRDLWELTDHDMADDIELMPVAPFCRFNWPDGSSFDLSNDEPALRREIARLAPGDLAGYEAFLVHLGEIFREIWLPYEAQPVRGFTASIRAAPRLLKHRAWRSVYDTLARYVQNEKLRQALSFQVLLLGGNPLTASGIHTVSHKLEKDEGVWWVRGGTSRLAAGMLRHFERLGGEVRLGDPVAAIETNGTRAEVETHSGWRGRFRAVASNADLMHTYRDLLAGSPRGRKAARRLARKRFSPSLFVVHLGIEGSWPGIPHRTVLFGPRYHELLEDLFEHGVLPADLPIFLHHPTVTDPSLAPEGKSTFQALVPVPHLGKLAIDWTQVGPVLEARVLAEIERRLIPDLSDRIVTQFHCTPRDLASDLNAHLGSAFSLEPIPAQSAWLRTRSRDKVIPNLYLVGAGTHPGAGIPGVIAGAKATAALMLKDLAV